MKERIEVKNQAELRAAFAAGKFPICVGSEYFELSGGEAAELRGNSQATLRGNSQATLRGNSQATLWGNSQATLWENRKIKAAKYCAVTVLSDQVTVEGGVQIRPPKRETAKAWCEFYGVEVVRGVALLYKAVNDKYISPRGCDYSPGLIPVATDWDGGKEECGGGLHFSPHPMMAMAFNNDATKFLACPVRLTDIAVHPDGNYPDKVKARGCCKPTYEVDKNGVRLEVKA